MVTKLFHAQLSMRSITITSVKLPQILSLPLCLGDLLFLLRFSSSSSPPKFCQDEFSVATWRIVLKFGDTVDTDKKLYKRN